MAGAAGVAQSRVLGANDRIRVALIGCGDRGTALWKRFLAQPDVQPVAVCDVYQPHLQRAAEMAPSGLRREEDFRRILDLKDVDAVIVATPDHWHALPTILACQAGKDVYVEKPCSHNVHEGRVAVQAARKNKRIVQHGTQNRRSQQWADLAALAKSGKLGKLLVSRGLCYKDGGTGGSTRGDIGTKPTKVPPSELDFNLWLGPAKEQPYHENLVHYRWHWFWDFGNGDMGNQGVHQMDIARWLIPGATWPKSVISFGGRYANNDQGETPNTQVTVRDFGETQLIFETRGLKSAKYRGQDVGNILQFEEGVVAGGKFYPKGKGDGEPIPKVPTDVKIGGDHLANFIQSVRPPEGSKLHADIEVGHISSGLCHLGHISHKLGTDAAYDPKLGKVSGSEHGTEALERMAEHLKDAGIKFDGKNLRVGRKLDFDAKAEEFQDKEANALLTRAYRKGFAVPDKV